MSIESATATPPTGASYFRTIAKLDAVAAQKMIGSFFGAVQEPVAAPGPQVLVTQRPPFAARFLVAGAAVLTAGLLAAIFRAQLPPTVPGFYLVLGGLVWVFCSAIYWWWFSAPVPKKKTRSENVADTAIQSIDHQIKHFEQYASQLFGAAQPGGHRVVLQGIGTREWNGGHDIGTREIGSERIYASIIHLIAIDLAPPFLSVRQLGLDLTTGTICDEWTTRRLMSDILTLTHRVKNAPASADWARASQIANEIADHEKKGGDRRTARIERLRAELSKLLMDDLCDCTFTLSFQGEEPITITIADRKLAKNPRNAAYPIGGKDNLNKAIAAWHAIEAARAAAATQHLANRHSMSEQTTAIHANVSGVRQDFAAFHETVKVEMTGLGARLSSLEQEFGASIKAAIATLPAGNPLASGTPAAALDCENTARQPGNNTPVAPHPNGDGKGSAPN